MRCVVVAETDPNVRQNLARCLEERGFRILLARTGREALANFYGEAVDAVIASVSLLELGGLELLSMVRRTAPGLPFFLIAGPDALPARDQTQRLGVQGVFATPLDHDALESALTAAIGSRPRPWRIVSTRPGMD